MDGMDEFWNFIKFSMYIGGDFKSQGTCERVSYNGNHNMSMLINDKITLGDLIDFNIDYRFKLQTQRQMFYVIYRS